MLTVIAKTVITVIFRPEEVGEWQEHRRGGEKTTGGACVRWRLQHAQHLRSHPHDSFRSIKHPWYHTGMHTGNDEIYHYDHYDIRAIF